MIRILRGKAHGRTIELDEELEVADGQEVEVQVRTIPKSERASGQGLLRTEGALADDVEWDGIMAEIYQARKLERRSPVANLEGA
jgi:hypothetical protein